MWWYYLIGFGIIIAIVAIYVLIGLNHNKYFFWKWPLFVPDRNGVRLPKKDVKSYFGKDARCSDSENFDKIKLLQSIQSAYDDFPDKKYSVKFTEDKSEFSIIFDDVELSNGGLRIWSHNQKYTTFKNEIDSENELQAFPLKLKSFNEEDGENYLGQYHDYLISWYSVDRDVLILTTIRIYNNPACVMFRIEFPLGLENTARSKYEELSIQFPVFKNNSNRSRVFTFDQVNFSEPRDKFIPTSAPVLFYNDKLETMILSPTMNFLISWAAPKKENIFEICLGLEGEIKNIPEQFVHETLLYSDQGITTTFKNWGNILLKYYQKNRLPNDADHILSYLGYWTDAGTYYYYNHEPFPNYERCLLELKKRADELEIPYGYFQLDSWFYPKDDGTVEWKALDEHFPFGIKGFTEQLKLPVICHNRWFSKNTVYRDKFQGFIEESHPKKQRPDWDPRSEKQSQMRTWTFPTNKEFWDFLMAEAQSWGCIAYEQDWLQPQWTFFDYLKQDVYAGRRWLYDMSEAAMNYNMSIQYCMTFPSFYLATLELPNVTHARCADDYNHRKPKRIYVPHFTQTSMLSWSVGVWPWKDPFYSTCVPKEKISIIKKIPQHHEKYPTLEFLLQVLSGGPVGNGDKIDYLNKELLLQSCRDDGLLLKPDRPAFPIDLMFMDHNKPYIVSTYSEILGAKWWYVLSVMVWDNKNIEKWLKTSELGLSRDYAVYDYENKKIWPVKPEDKISLKNHTGKFCLNQHKYLVFAPILANGMAFFGFRDKITTMASSVFEKVMVSRDTLHIKGKYLPFKEFAIIVYVPTKPKKVIINGGETEQYTWGPNYKTLTLLMKNEKEEFSIAITA